MAKSGFAANKALIGSWAFLGGVALAIIFGILGSVDNALLTTILIVIGLVVGFLNVKDEEASPFLMSGAVLLIAGWLGKDVVDVIPWAANILKALLVIFVPATIIVAIKNVFSIARN